MLKKDTYTRAFEACEAFFAETGQMPTIETVKAIIVTNSPSIISSAIKDWKAALAQAVKKDQGLAPGVPKALSDALAAVWEQALEAANTEIKAKVDEMQAKQTVLAAKEAELAAETGRVQQLVQLTEQKFQEEIGYLKKETGRLAAEAQAATGQAEHYRAAAAAADKEIAVLAEGLRQEKEKRQRLEIQYDREHDWALQRIEEEKDSHRQKTQHEMNRLQSDATRSKQAEEIAQAKLAQLGQQVNEYRDRAARLEKSLANETLKIAGLTLDKANLQSELNKSEEKLRLLLAKKEKTR